MSPNVTDSPENRMDVHKNARLTPRGREAMVRAVVDQRLTQVGSRTALQHIAQDGRQVGRALPRRRRRGLQDRSSRPRSLPSQTAIATCDAVEVLRRQRQTQAAIAQPARPVASPPSAASSGAAASVCSQPWSQRSPGPATSARAPARSFISTSRSSAGSTPSATASPAIAAGQSTFPLGRTRGWEFVHVAIDDHSRIACSKSSPMKSRRAPSRS